VAAAGLAATAVAVAPTSALAVRPTATIPTPVSCYNYTPPVPGTPSITSLKVSPKSVNVKHGDKKVTFTVTAKDTGAHAKNITRIVGAMVSPKVGKVTRSAYLTFKRTSGNAKNGTWKATTTIPRWTNNGSWTINGLSAVDAGYGTAYYSPVAGGTWGSSWPRHVTVISTPDVTPPKITKITLSKKSVSTAKSAKKINVTVRTSDARSGAKSAYVGGYYSSKTQSHGVSAYLKRSGGSTNKAVFTGTLNIPRWVGKAKHTWSLNASVSDALFNSQGYSAKQLKAKKLKNSFKVKSSDDKTKPTLPSVSFTPKTIDVKKASKSVTVTAKLKDTHSGVSYVNAQFTTANGYGASYSASLKRTGGKATNGTWKGKIVFPKCTPPAGTYRLSLSAGDAAGNYNYFSADSLAARHIAVNLKVNSTDTTSPTASSPSTVSTSGGVVLTFSEPTLWTGPASSLLTLRDSSYSTVAGTWTCKNSAGTTVTCDANGANVKTVSFTPTTPFTASSTYYIVGSYPTGIYDTSGNALYYVSTTFST